MTKPCDRCGEHDKLMKRRYTCTICGRKLCCKCAEHDGRRTFSCINGVQRDGRWLGLSYSGDYPMDCQTPDGLIIIGVLASLRLLLEIKLPQTKTTIQ